MTTQARSEQTKAADKHIQSASRSMREEEEARRGRKKNAHIGHDDHLEILVADWVVGIHFVLE